MPCARSELVSAPSWHYDLLYREPEKSKRLHRKSGRSKKGGAGTSACLRKLRGRSTTSLCERPVHLDGPFAFSGAENSSSRA